MKKNLLVAVLILAVFTSLTAGTLAKYTKAIGTYNATGVAKNFNFTTAETGLNDSRQIRIAPGETAQYQLKVHQNSEVPVDYTAVLGYSGDPDPLFYNRLNVTVTYKIDNANAVTISPVGPVTIPTVAAGEHDIFFTYSCEWKKDNNDAADTSAIGRYATMSLQVKGDQHIGT